LGRGSLGGQIFRSIERLCQKCTDILGDSGSIVLARDGRIVGILDGGAGPTDETDTTYLTPYWWIEQQIKSKYPGCFLYDVDE
jgi:hypothetical protein